MQGFLWISYTQEYICHPQTGLQNYICRCNKGGGKLALCHHFCYNVRLSNSPSSYLVEFVICEVPVMILISLVSPSLILQLNMG